MKKPFFYGCEDLPVKKLASTLFELTGQPRYLYTYSYPDRVYTIYPIEEEYVYSGGPRLSLNMEQHAELLDNAKKLYVHPNCTIPRDLVAKKYKRCLNPYLADAVIIPNPDFNEVDISMDSAAFATDHTVVTSNFYLPYDDGDVASYQRIKDAKEGTKIESLVGTLTKDTLPSWIAGAKLFYNGPIAIFYNKHKYIMDYLDLTIPRDKLVYENTLIKTLNDESNVPTFDSMVSIFEMLKSSDESVVEVGLKSLASMDYVSYPNSIKTVLVHTSNWSRNKATFSTAVKFMFKQLGIKPGHCIIYSNRTINKEDYELFEKLIKYIEGLSDESYKEYCYGISFIYVDIEGKIVPRIVKQ